MVSKQAFSTKDGSVLKQFKEFFAVSENVQKQDPSTIYYMEILDENPDSNDTMRQVVELLLDNISSDHQGKYVILVGDGKTYDHLMQIKAQQVTHYGTWKQRMSHKEREFKHVTKCLHRRLAWCNRIGQSYDPAIEQYSMFH